jgi:predicted nucleic acid-binding protein
MTWLLDANVLTALFDVDHVHRPIVRDWYVSLDAKFATCPIVESALVCWLVRLHGRDGTAWAARELAKLAADPRHVFWPNDISMASVRWDGVLGHRQVTDAYVAALARHHGGKVATLDSGFAALHDDVVELIPY